MTQEEKELLLRDLSARLPYGVLCHINGDTNTPRKLSRIEVDELDGILLDFWTDREDYLSMQVYLSEVKPYLRPMSSMTEEEEKEYKHLVAFSGSPNGAANFTDWLNKKMFAYRTIDGNDGKDMFELGVALKVTEENNPYR